MSISEHEAKVLSDFEAYEAEVDALKARAETAERDLNIARGLISRLGDLDALESLNALLRHERTRVAELEREREHLSGRVTEVVAAWHASMADASRLREALEEIAGTYDDGTPAQVIAEDALAMEPSTALASAPSAEPTPRDMRVACRAWNHGFTKGREYEALDTLEAMQRVGEFTLGEGIDLAAVVAKAVGT